MNENYLSTMYVGPERMRFTDEETLRHLDASVCKARGGSPLIRGARSPGRWDPACSCGWRNASNSGRAYAESKWRDHRRTAVFEERRLAEGLPVFRVLVVHDRLDNFGAEQAIREWRGFESIEAAELTMKNDGTSYAKAFVERSSDGEKWERV